MNAIQQPDVFGTVTVGERGQIVIPSHLRDRLKLKKGDKLMVFCHLGQIIGLIRANEINAFLNKIAGRMLKNVEKFKQTIKEQEI